MSDAFSKVVALFSNKQIVHKMTKSGKIIESINPEKIMKRAVSVSLGSSKRDKSVEVELLGEKVWIERIGTNGDMEKAAQLYKDLDGKVDAFGVGGADLGLTVGEKWYALHSVKPMVRYVEETPIVDGSGLKLTLEATIANFIRKTIPEYIYQHGKKVLIMTGADRWGLARSFLDDGYDCTFGDLIFSLGIPVPLHSEWQLKLMAALIIPIASRVPFEWIYPTGEKQDERKPKQEDLFWWATVTAGDCHYVKRYMPGNMQGKVVVTNTTTEQDIELFRSVGVKYLITTTPILDGRSFGTNMMEAALIAASGKRRPLAQGEIKEILETLDFKPQIQELC